MRHQSGVVTALNQGSGEGFLSQGGTIEGVVSFKQMHVDGLRSLCVGEPVLYDVVGENRYKHAEHIRRSAGELEIYQNLGGLYS